MSNAERERPAGGPGHAEKHLQAEETSDVTHSPTTGNPLAFHEWFTIINNSLVRLPGLTALRRALIECRFSPAGVPTIETLDDLEALVGERTAEHLWWRFKFARAALAKEGDQ